MIIVGSLEKNKILLKTDSREKAQEFLEETNELNLILIDTVTDIIMHDYFSLSYYECPICDELKYAKELHSGEACSSCYVKTQEELSNGY